MRLRADGALPQTPPELRPGLDQGFPVDPMTRFRRDFERRALRALIFFAYAAGGGRAPASGKPPELSANCDLSYAAALSAQCFFMEQLRLCCCCTDPTVKNISVLQRALYYTFAPHKKAARVSSFLIFFAFLLVLNAKLSKALGKGEREFEGGRGAPFPKGAPLPSSCRRIKRRLASSGDRRYAFFLSG